MKKNVLILLCGILLAGCQTMATRPAPLPEDTKITKPSNNVPSEYSAFSGIWAGDWGGGLDGKIAVQVITENGDASGIYAVGDEPSGMFYAQKFPFKGTIANGVLSLSPFSNGADVKYKLLDKSVLEGTYSLKGGNTIGIFKKQ